MELDLIRTKLNIKYYQGLLYSLSEDNPNYNWINEYYKNLLNMIKNDDKMSDENKNDESITEKISEKISDKLDLTSSIESDNSWSLLLFRAAFCFCFSIVAKK